MKDVFTAKCRLTLMISYLNINMGFAEGFNAQHWLVSMIEKWKESVDNGGAFGALMTSLMLLTVYIIDYS